MEKNKIKHLVSPLVTRFEELQRMVGDPSFHKNPEFAPLSKEYRLLSERVKKIQQWKKIITELKHLDEMIETGEPELSQMARLEKGKLQEQCSAVEAELLRILMPPDPHDEKDIILEIRAGTGGEESALFGSELARMYMKYAELNGLRCEMIDASLTDRGGFKEVIFSIERPVGQSNVPGAFSIFKYERGVHRVQRVPITEASGRIHTSTVTVAVLPEAEDVEVKVRSEDLRIDTYRASGHGGQHLQKTDSAVRITHIPSSLVVQCQDERSQQKNREKAMKFLRAKILEIAEQNQTEKIASERKKQVGHADRSEKIRTYNFPQDRITDHRIGFSIRNIQEIMDGHLGPIVEALRADEEKRLTSSQK